MGRGPFTPEATLDNVVSMAERPGLAGGAGWLDPLVELVREQDAQERLRRELRWRWAFVAVAVVAYHATVVLLVLEFLPHR